MHAKLNFNTSNFTNVIESKVTISGRSIKKINKYIDKFYIENLSGREENMNKLSLAQKEYGDCICLLEETGDWKAFITRKKHTNKIVIHLRLLSNYFRNLEDFVDSFLISKLKVSKNHINIQINQLLPDRDFSPVFIPKTIWKQICLSILINGTAICLSYLKIIEVDKKTGIDLLWLIAAANSYAIFDIIKSLLKNRNKPWIKT